MTHVRYCTGLSKSNARDRFSRLITSIALYVCTVCMFVCTVCTVCMYICLYVCMYTVGMYANEYIDTYSIHTAAKSADESERVLFVKNLMGKTFVARNAVDVNATKKSG